MGSQQSEELSTHRLVNTESENTNKNPPSPGSQAGGPRAGQQRPGAAVASCVHPCVLGWVWTAQRSPGGTASSGSLGLSPTKSLARGQKGPRAGSRAPCCLFRRAPRPPPLATSPKDVCPGNCQANGAGWGPGWPLPPAPFLPLWGACCPFEPPGPAVLASELWPGRSLPAGPRAQTPGTARPRWPVRGVQGGEWSSGDTVALGSNWPCPSWGGLSGSPEWGPLSQQGTRQPRKWPSWPAGPAGHPAPRAAQAGGCSRRR